MCENGCGSRGSRGSGVCRGQGVGYSRVVEASARSLSAGCVWWLTQPHSASASAAAHQKNTILSVSIATILKCSFNTQALNHFFSSIFSSTNIYLEH